MRAYQLSRHAPESSENQLAGGPELLLPAGTYISGHQQQLRTCSAAMSVGEFTSSSIAASMDHGGQENGKTHSAADNTKLQGEISRQKEAAKEVCHAV